MRFTPGEPSEFVAVSSTVRHNIHRLENAMPYSAKAHRLFEAAAHNPQIAKAHGMSQAEAKKLASEGVKKTPWHLALKKKKK